MRFCMRRWSSAAANESETTINTSFTSDSDPDPDPDPEPDAAADANQPCCGQDTRTVAERAAGTPPTPAPYDVVGAQLGPRLRRARLVAGLTLEGLAERAEVSVPTIRRAERGERPPRMDTLRKLALALNISIGMLLTDADTDTDMDTET